MKQQILGVEESEAIVRSWATRDGAVRVAWKDTTERVHAFRREIADAFSLARASLTWSEVDRFIGNCPLEVDERLAEAAGILARTDLRRLLDCLSEYDDPLTIARLAPDVYQHSEPSIFLEWIRSGCGYLVTSLGVSRLVESLAIFARKVAHDGGDGANLGGISHSPSEGVETVLANALSTRALGEQVRLWWQILVLSRAIDGYNAKSPHQLSVALYNRASYEIATWAESNQEYLPDDVLDALAPRDGRRVVCALGLAAYYLRDSPTLAETMAARLAQLVESELRSDSLGFTLWKSPGAEFRIRMASYALTCGARVAGPEAWRRMLDEWAVVPGGWHFSHSGWGESVRGAAWLFCVGIVAAVRTLEEGDGHGEEIALEILHRIDAVWDQWLWHDKKLLYIELLPAYLGLLCSKMPNKNDRNVWAMRLARPARSASTIALIADNARQGLDEPTKGALDAMLDRWNAHSEALNGNGNQRSGTPR